MESDRVYGAIVGASIATIPAGAWLVLNAWLGQVDPLISVIAVEAVATGAIVGWQCAPNALGSGRVRVILGMAVRATVIGAYAVGASIAVPAAFLRGSGLLPTVHAASTGTIQLGTYGLVLLGLPALVITAIASAAWLWVMRRPSGRAGSRGPDPGA